MLILSNAYETCLILVTFITIHNFWFASTCVDTELTHDKESPVHKNVPLGHFKTL
jgi:hypothetical protein